MYSKKRSRRNCLHSTLSLSTLLPAETVPQPADYITLRNQIFILHRLVDAPHKSALHVQRWTGPSLELVQIVVGILLRFFLKALRRRRRGPACMQAEPVMVCPLNTQLSRRVKLLLKKTKTTQHEALHMLAPPDGASNPALHCSRPSSMGHNVNAAAVGVSQTRTTTTHLTSKTRKCRSQTATLTPARALQQKGAPNGLSRHTNSMSASLLSSKKLVFRNVHFGGPV